MNHYTQLLRHIKSLGESDGLINTITNTEPDKIDWRKENIFPLLNVSITGGSFTNGSTVVFSVELACLNVREINKELKTSKFYDNDNEVDNMNNTLAILNRLWTVMYKDFNDNNIRATENPTLNPVFEERTNLLDGWVMEFDVELPNTTLNLCNQNSISVLSVSNDTVTEGQQLTHNVVLLEPTYGITNISIKITDVTTTESDYSSTLSFTNGVTKNQGVLIIPKGIDAFSIYVDSLVDVDYETPESYNISVGSITATGNITPPPITVLSVGDDAQNEGVDLTHLVTLSAPTFEETIIPFSITSGTATEGVDWLNTLSFTDGVTVDGTDVLIPIGVSSFSVSYPTATDIESEINETVNVIFGGEFGIGTIVNVAPSQQVVYVDSGATTKSTNASTIDVAHPSTVNAGELLILKITNGFPVNFNTPSGWTLIEQRRLNVNRSIFQSYGVWYKVADGTEAGTNVTVTTDAVSSNIHMGAISRFDGGTTYSIEDSQVYESSAGTISTHPSNIVSCTVDGSLHLDLVVISDNVSITPPVEMTQEYYDTTFLYTDAAIGLYSNEMDSGESSNGGNYTLGGNCLCFISSFIINP